MKTNAVSLPRFLAHALALLVLLVVVCLPLRAGGDAPPTFKLTALDMQKGVALLDGSAWLYRMGDDPAWAAKEIDDSAWATKGFDDLVRKPETATIDGRWDGMAWFRLRLEVEDALVGRPLALRLRHWGASEIYIDGQLLRRFGVIGSDSDVEENPRGLPVPFVFKEGGSHTIALRYSYKAARDMSSGMGRWLARAHFPPGFVAFVQPAERAFANYGRSSRESRGYLLFVGILLSLALLHFLLYIFYRSERANLFYSLFVFGLAATIVFQSAINGEVSGVGSAFVAAICFVFFIAAYAVAFTSLLAFVYIVSARRFTKRFYGLFALWGVLIVIAAIYVRDYITLYFAALSFVLTLIEAIYIMIRALIARRDGAWIIMTGILLFAAGMLILLGREMGIYALPPTFYGILELFILLAVPIAVSIFLARNIARTNTNLEAQLVQVRELSAKQLEHEQTRAESERRAKELEEARQLQLSMLPKTVPRLPNVEIAAYMKPASEVGGDYYDFHLGDDGTLTVAVGDATGHGLKAGTMVTATKSLFNNLAHEADIAYIFKQSSAALKKMNLRGLFMAMTILKITGQRLLVSAAGMPSALIYRAATGEVEEIMIRAMPLGSTSNFAYKQHEYSLLAGDCVVVMSDGFPELFNEQNEMFDYARARRTFAEVAGDSPQEIINRFVETGEKWAGNRPADDDVTFVVMKIK
jgi:serine phosphatase RsbU (regulator of sigma subunit)